MVIALAAVLVIACGFLTYADVFAGLRRDKTAVSVYFPSDSSTGEIAEILHENDIIIFGSRVNGEFVLDTVFVVECKIKNAKN